MSLNKKVLVYQDEGTDKLSVNSLCHEIEEDLDTAYYSVETVSSDYLLSGVRWEDETEMLVLPGGADRMFEEKLKGSGNRRIRTFVERGGKYLGVGAGGYYASSKVEFALGTKNEVSERRDLNFFDGTAAGPVYHSGFSYDFSRLPTANSMEIIFSSQDPSSALSSLSSSWPFSSSSSSSSSTLLLFYNGGSTFENVSNYPNTQVLAWYRGRMADGRESPLPAIVYSSIGNGRVVLSGPHFEIKTTYGVRNDIDYALSQYETQRKDLQRYLLGNALGLRMDKGIEK
eukprot:gb/GECH01003474.1/.p1 GENE.gb/GECH01003474.1/~~gb/GECH01003474.1/.p1  ORF type:complete len:286 (+),score=72.54 gb/GECH01003474.1/:1-858(+)